MSQEEFVQKVCDRLNACRHPRQVYEALWLLAKSVRPDSSNKEVEGHGSEKNL